jgi:hypothetical protein
MRVRRLVDFPYVLVRLRCDGCNGVRFEDLPPKRPPDLPSALMRFRVVKGGKSGLHLTENFQPPWTYFRSTNHFVTRLLTDLPPQPPPEDLPAALMRFRVVKGGRS